MNLQKNYILLSFATLLFIGFMILLSILLLAKNNIFPGAIYDLLSFSIVNIGAYLLFMMAFGIVKKSNSDFFYYKLIWMQEMLVILGFLGIGLGFVFMVSGMLIPPPPGVDPTAKLIGSMAIACITVVYGFVGALGFYLLQKYYEFRGDNNKIIEVAVPKEGFQFQSLIYFIIFLFIILFSSYIGASDAGTELKNIFTFDAFIVVICLNILFIFLYKGNFLNLLKNIFWYSPDTDNIIRYNLKFIRSIKKITSMIMALILIMTPIVLLAALSMPPQEHEHGYSEVSLLVFINILIYYIAIILKIILINVIEAREVSRLYLVTGKISAGDRYYTITYILPPAILLYITLMLTVYWTTLY